MPRDVTTRIDPRVATDVPQTASVPLQVQAQLPRNPGTSPAWALASSLQGFASTYADVQATKDATAEKARIQKAKEDEQLGKQAADKQAVTGEAPSLEGMSQEFTAAYRQTDGLRLADEFGNQLAPQLAQLEPGKTQDEINQFIQGKAKDYLEQNGVDQASQPAFMQAISKAQVGWKDQYNRQSIAEALKRDEENLGAIGTAAIKSGSLLTEDGLKGYFDSLTARGLGEAEAHKIVAQAFTASLATGQTNIPQAMAVLKTPLGSSGTSIGDIPEYKSQLDLAAKRGQQLIDDAQKKAQADNLTHALYRMGDSADQGLLSDREIDANRKRFDLTPEWAAGMHNRNREAQQRLAKENESAENERMVFQALQSGDPVQIAAMGTAKVSAAADKVMLAAYKQGGDQATLQVAGALSRVNAPVPFLKQLSGSFDPSDQQNALRTISFFNNIKSQSKDYFEQNVTPEFSAKMRRFEIETQTFGLSPQQALQKIAQTEPAMDHGATSAAVATYYKQHSSAIPTTFGDSSILSGKFTSTPIRNLGYVNTQVQDIMKELMSTGMLKPDDAAKAAVERFQATNVRVGDMYVPVPAGTTPKVGEAFTQLAQDYKDRMVKDKQIDDTGTVYFQPAVNNSGKWVLMVNDDGVSRAVVERKPGAEPRLVELDSNAVLAKHTTWTMQKNEQDTVRKQGLKQLGYGYISGASPEDQQSAVDQLAKTPDTLQGVTGMTLNGKVISDGYTHNKQDAEKLKSLLDTTKTKSFVDYLHNTQ